MSARTFLDTNVLVYAYDTAEPRKQRIAQELLAAAPAESLVISSQVLSEFYVTVTRKLPEPLSLPDASAAVRQLSTLHVVPVDGELVVTATEFQQRWQTSYWDALILAAASGARSAVLLSEDLADGATLAGVTIENPFVA
ncbi:MAG: PIN domain-containing protein [Solirubrobacteraceae bacterium]